MSLGVSGIIGKLLDTYVLEPYIYDRNLQRNKDFNAGMEGESVANAIRSGISSSFGGTGQARQPRQYPIGNIPNNSFIAMQQQQQQPQAPAPVEQQPGFYDKIWDRIKVGETPDTDDPANAVFGYNRYRPEGPYRPITEMSYNDVIDYSRRVREHPDNTWNSGAIGAPQFVPGTLKSAWKSAGLGPEDLYTEANQRKAVDAHIKPMYEEYKAGTLSEDNFRDWLSTQWPSLKDSQGRQTISNQPAPSDTENLFASINNDVQQSQAELQQLQQESARATATPQGVPNASDLSRFAVTGDTLKDVYTQDVKQKIPQVQRGLNERFDKYVRHFQRMAINPNYTDAILPNLTSGTLAGESSLRNQMQEQRAGYVAKPNPWSDIRINPRDGKAYGIWNADGIRYEVPGVQSPATQGPLQYDIKQGLGGTQVTDIIGQPPLITKYPRFPPSETNIPPGDKALQQEKAKRRVKIGGQLYDQLYASKDTTSAIQSALNSAKDIHTGIWGNEIQALRKFGSLFGVKDWKEGAAQGENITNMATGIKLNLVTESKLFPTSDKDFEQVANMAPSLLMTENGMRILLEMKRMQVDHNEGLFKFAKDKYGQDYPSDPVILEYKTKIQESGVYKNLLERAEAEVEGANRNNPNREGIPSVMDLFGG